MPVLAGSLPSCVVRGVRNTTEINDFSFVGRAINCGPSTIQKYNSKLELESELDRARAADLVKRVEAAVGAAGA